MWHIQELLGHEKSAATEIDTQVSDCEKQQVVSLLDLLEDLDGVARLFKVLDIYVVVMS